MKASRAPAPPWRRVIPSLPPRTCGWRSARSAQVTGRVDVEDVLDRLFATFCIGK